MQAGAAQRGTARLPHAGAVGLASRMDSPMDTYAVREGGRAVVSLFAAVGAEGLEAAPVLALARGASTLTLTDLGPALAACGLAYAGPRARHAAAGLLAAVASGFSGPVAAGAPDAASARLGAEASGVAPLPALVIADGGPRRLSLAASLAIPPALLPAARIALLGHGHLPAFLGLAAADAAAIAAFLPRALSLAHAAALAGRIGAVQAIDPARREEADAFIFGENLPPGFLPEAIAAALMPGADGPAIAAMAATAAPHLAEPPFCPGPLVPLPRRRRAAALATPLPLFPEAASRPGLRAVS